MQAPNKCPMCGAQDEWHLIDTAKKGFNAKHAVIGGLLLNGVGLVAGFSGKRKSLYQCGKCGFSHEYDGDIAEKDKFVEFPPKGYTNKGLNAAFIDTIRRVTPECVFCGKPQSLYVKSDGSSYRFLCEHCHAEFRCEFTFSGKVKAATTQIIECGEVNKDNLSVGACDPNILIHDKKNIK